MKIVKELESKIDKVLYDYEKLKIENKNLQLEIENLKNENDKIRRNNEDMFLKIDSALAFSKVKKSD